MSEKVVVAVEIEPTTSRLRVECSQQTNRRIFIDLMGFTAFPLIGLGIFGPDEMLVFDQNLT